VKLPDIDLFRPDKNRLDEELQEQPKLCRIYSEHLADAQRDLDEAEARLDFVKADLDNQIRASPADFCIDRITEPAVKLGIILQKRYQAANKKVIEARYRVNQLKGICNAIEHRKKSVEQLVYLFGQDYWAEPRISSERRKPVEDQIVRKAFTKRRTS
jgi:hypothetical protein